MAKTMRGVNMYAIDLIMKLMVCLILTLVVGACDQHRREPAAWDPTATEVATIRVTPNAVRLMVGQTQQIFAMLGDAAGNKLPVRMVRPGLEVDPAKQETAVIGDSMGRTGHIVVWRSSQPALVTIDSKGLLRAVSSGETTITASCRGLIATAKIIVIGPSTAPLSVIPAHVGLFVGETLQFRAVVRKNKDNIATELTEWRSDRPSRATVSRDGLVKAITAGEATITATRSGQRGTAVVEIKPSEILQGIDFSGNAGAKTTMRFEFAAPLEAYPATYIWRVYPRQQQSYYTAFFWGNNGKFYPSNTYYGFHPYPDWKTSFQHYWEIAAAPGGDFTSPVHVVYDRWYIQAAICRKSDDATEIEFYWDWPDITKVVKHKGKHFDDPPSPGLVVGDAPWNQGNEVWDGVLRGFQFYDVAMTTNQIKQEIASPGSLRRPWYLNLNPTPVDISDRSGNGHNPAWVGAERPYLWTGTASGGIIILSTTSSR